jgi:hypothetical protein
VARIEALVTMESGLAGQELLSLSFSRAAVGELRRRLAALSNRGSRVRSATFDSFATRLLQLYGDSSLEGVDYDTRIELATALIDRAPIEELREIRHVCVDEAQDLTGVRSDFVLKLLEVTNCGFTVFADQAQAVYDFAGESVHGDAFTTRLHDTFAMGLVELELHTNYRTSDPALLAISRLGDLIRTDHAEREEVVSRFDSAVRGLTAAGSIGDVSFMLQGAVRTAILTRRNSEALEVSRTLYEAGVPHQFRRRADDPIIGGWLARLAATADSHRIGLASMEQMAAMLPWEPQTTWDALSRASRPKRETINLGQLADALAARTPHDELIETRLDGVSISSIHRAKGLEFDTVLIVPFQIDQADWLQEARVLYVGLTRAKHDLMALKPVDDGRWSYSVPAQRWRRIAFAGKARYTRGIEISGLDAATFDSAGANPPRRETAALSEYLLTAVKDGDPVILELREPNSQLAVYDVTHNGEWVAATTPQFGAIISQRLGLKSAPDRIEGCRVETISTTPLAAPVAEVLGITTQLVPNCRIQGVGTW